MQGGGVRISSRYTSQHHLAMEFTKFYEYWIANYFISTMQLEIYYPQLLPKIQSFATFKLTRIIIHFSKSILYS